MERCKHGLLLVSCAYCGQTQEPKRTPRCAEERIPHAARALDGARFHREGYAVVHTGKGRDKCGTAYIDEETTFVHIDGQPNLWAIQQILERAPNLKTIQVIPSMYRMIHPDSHLRLCTERGVEIIKGHIRPELIWEEGRIVSPHYQKQRAFLKGLSGDQKKLFEELVAMGFEAALITARYFCLNDEEYRPQRLFLAEYGFSQSNVHHLSAKINSVLCYLDENFAASEVAMNHADTLKERVARLRPYLESEELRRQCAAKLGIPSLSARFPIARINLFAAILQAQKDGRLARLASDSPNDHQSLTLRFGLDDLSAGVYRTLEQVGALMNLTRERIRQLEYRALATLGISEDT